MDGLTGLENILKEEFAKAKVSRFERDQVHVARNMPAKVSHSKLKKSVADDLRSIFYASFIG